MKRTLLRFLLGSLVFHLGFSAHALVILPTFDQSIVTNANSAAIMGAINGAIQVLQSALSDNVTVKITFVADESVGLGQSSTAGGEYPYADFIAALRSRASTVSDTNALSKLPNSATDPVVGGSQIHLTTPQARLLGLDNYSDSDATVSLKMSLMNFSRPPANPNKYDLQQVVEHEVDEVLGISSGLPDSIIYPVDLFRYTTNLVRTYTTNGDNAYFCPDGTNRIARYNNDPSGDYGDWWSVFSPTNWSPTTGITLNYAQVQDAFSASGTAIDIGVAELIALDVVGWTPASVSTSRPVLQIVRSSPNTATVSWSGSATGFVLQERTNLVAGAWAGSLTGSTNPAVVSTAGGQKFYRLYNASATPSALPEPHAVPAVQSSPKSFVLRGIQPRKP